MLINLSNHPSDGWSDSQLAAAREWGEITDLSFPVIDPESDEETIKELANAYQTKIDDMLSGAEMPNAVHLMGEHTFCFAMARLLQQAEIPCLVSTTHRQVTSENNGTKTTYFRFVKFRKYPVI